MKVKIIKTGVVEDHDPSFAVRLIEQGKAILAPDDESTKPEKGKAGSGK